MLFRKNKNLKKQHADTAVRKVEKFLRSMKVDAVIVDDDPLELELLVRELRSRGIKCVGYGPEDADRVIGACDPRVIVLDFLGNEEVAHRLAMEYPERAVVCSGLLSEALDTIAAKVKKVFSKHEVDELADYIKTK